MPFLEGFATGLALIVLIGPVLFVLLASTVEHGRKAGFAVAIGILASDILCVTLLRSTTGSVLTDPRYDRWLAIGGAVLLAGLGVSYLARSSRRFDRPVALPARGLAGFFAKGFLVNFVNPFVFAVWFGIIAAAAQRHGTGPSLVWFLTGTITAIFTLDSTKVLLAGTLRSWLRPRVLTTALRVSGVLLLGLGARLLVHAL